MQSCESVIENKKSKMVNIVKLLPDELNSGKKAEKLGISNSKAEIYIENHTEQGGHDSKHLKLPKDLREMNEEQFRYLYEYLREQTNNFSNINVDFLKKNPQYLIVFRLTFGLSQEKMSQMIGTKQFVRHFEAGRQNYKRSSKLKECANVLNTLGTKRKLVPLSKSLDLFIRYRRARRQFFYKSPDPNYQLKRIFEMSPKKFEIQFNFLKDKTKNFNVFEPNLFIQNPQLFAVFRVILDMNIQKFSSAIGKSARVLRKYESFGYRMMPETAKEIAERIGSLFIERKFKGNVNFNDVVENFQRFTFFEPKEVEIMKLLMEHSIPYEIHANLNGIKKKLNVDFVIPSSKSPLIILEVTKLSTKKRKDIVHRIAYIDHRFQLLKLSNPRLITFIIIECSDSQEKLVRRIVEREVVNTDFCLINEKDGVYTKVKNTLKLIQN